MDGNNEQEYVRISILESIVEAQIVSSILEEEGIPYRIRSYHDTAYDGLFQLQKGWGELSSPLSYQEEILKIIDDVRAGTFEAEDDDFNDDEFDDDDGFDDDDDDEFDDDYDSDDDDDDDDK
ncbi:MAG: hypothetical protein BWK80_60645 [Desulfobacteraceae bacterium IS3]|nr:MAG: hypothetical protein BWK80_60645 [Desulfobacteraceae bacterium IS3]